jgi:hypothetical protein
MKTFSSVAIALAGMTGLVAAQPKAADPKMPPRMENKPEIKPTDPKAAGAMPAMTPPPELAAVAKGTSGTWTCKGQGIDHAMKMTDMIGTMKIKLEVDNWWMHASFESRMGKDPFRFESFTTFDPAARKWKRVMVESGGGWSSGESAGLKDNKLDWDLTSHSAMGEAMFRDHEDLSDAKAGAKMWGELSTDKGKTWMKVYEMTCKK